MIRPVDDTFVGRINASYHLRRVFINIYTKEQLEVASRYGDLMLRKFRHDKGTTQILIDTLSMLTHTIELYLLAKEWDKNGGEDEDEDDNFTVDDLFAEPNDASR